MKRHSAARTEKAFKINFRMPPFVASVLVRVLCRIVEPRLQGRLPPADRRNKGSHCTRATPAGRGLGYSYGRLLTNFGKFDETVSTN
jgi:hypothetical protein